MKLVFRVSSNQRLILVEEAIEQMLAFRQRSWWQSEAGGVLLGRHLLDTDDVVVDEVTTPQKSDRRSRFGFFRSKKHSTIAQGRWSEEASTVAYLGLWHTHPEPDPTPSGIDRQDWKQALSKDTFHGDMLFFPIVGIERIRVWAMTTNGAFFELKEEEKNG
ncbi:Mov34/MPN/PAD-1 family protein [Janthinobacterium sp. SUN120]|uniref:Mov34/MPN/PAD-1 family protein n=1 Tax=Janthinobacterium sp. SUN120 TaxID=3004099 RepID=UPI0025B266FC|nr:Mov34/MPN/PAD-1 family protein [Janthinobacterium sp. SUN120]MDN2713684.1 Mov34/MPN/PAD-1 family protein [Janthinobacterium sp. SUN120]